MEWAKTDEIHKRSSKEEGVKNMEIIYDSVTHIISAPYKELNEKLPKTARVLPQTDTYHVSYPCLVNTVPMKAGQELILTWKPTKPGKDGKDDKTVPRKNAFDQIAHADRKLRKAKTRATSSTAVG